MLDSMAFYSSSKRWQLVSALKTQSSKPNVRSVKVHHGQPTGIRKDDDQNVECDRLCSAVFTVPRRWRTRLSNVTHVYYPTFSTLCLREVPPASRVS